jgi:predicted nucleic acid-binding protein
MTSRVIVDTCVLADCLFKERPRHSLALGLVEELKHRSCTVVVPAHSFFELISVALSEKHRRGTPLSLSSFGKDLSVPIEMVAIDLPFIQSYLIEPAGSGIIIEGGGADAIFISIALKRGLPLISEDDKMLKRARAVGVSGHTIHEFLRTTT